MLLLQKRLTYPGLALCLAATVPGVSLAVEYSTLPSITLQETYNDNIGMSRTLSESATGTILTPRLNLTARTAAWQVGTDMNLRAARYQGIKGVDSNGRTVNLFAQIRSERNTLQAGGGVESLAGQYRISRPPAADLQGVSFGLNLGKEIDRPTIGIQSFDALIASGTQVYIGSDLPDGGTCGEIQSGRQDGSGYRLAKRAAHANIIVIYLLQRN